MRYRYGVQGLWALPISAEADQALLGVVTLEILGLVFNPFDRTLHPMRMLLS